MKRLTIVCIGFMASLMLVYASYAQIDAETCVGMWLFDKSGAEKAVDSTPNGNDGTFKGGPEWGDGKFGSALKLDGTDDYVEVPDAESLDTVLNEGLTIVAWVNGEFRAGDWHGIVTNSGGWAVEMCYLLQRNANGFLSLRRFHRMLPRSGSLPCNQKMVFGTTTSPPQPNLRKEAAEAPEAPAPYHSRPYCPRLPSRTTPQCRIPRIDTFYLIDLALAVTPCF